MTIEILPAAEVVMIAWTKTKSSIISLLGTDGTDPAIGSSLPSSSGTPMPFLTLWTPPGGVDVTSGENVPVTVSWLQVDAFSTTKKSSSDIMQTFLAEIREFDQINGAAFGGGHLYSMELINGPRRLYERDQKYWRFSSDIQISYRKS